MNDTPKVSPELQTKFAIIPVSIIADRRLNPTMRVVFEALLSFRRARQGRVYASLDAISERCGGIHPDNVSKALNALKRSGFLEIKRNRRGCNDYQILTPLHDWSPGQDLPHTGKSNPPPDNQDLAESANSKAVKTWQNPPPRLGETCQPPETNIETKEESRAKRASAGPGKRKKRTGADTLPDDLPADLLDLAKKERSDMSPSLLYRTWRKFVSHHRGYGTRSPDWTALWTAYVLSERLTPEQQAESKTLNRFSKASL